ncbi:MAG TPA: TonB-dependent receptor, partial [Deltaproteobacteria bacterium]|nr:TonB-dependent receptor [Deltaproteobacteria bacterium]
AEMDEVDLTATQGSSGMGLYHGRASMKLGRTGVLATITRAFSDNDFRYDRDDGTRATRQNNGVENTTGLLKATFDVQGWKTSLMGSFIDQFAGSPGSEGSAGYLTPHDKVSSVQATYLARTSRELTPDQSIDLRAWMLTSRTHTESIPFGDSRTRLVQESGAVSYERRFGVFSIAPRAEYLQERMSSDDYGRHTRGTLSGVMSAEMDAQPFLVQLTGRCDDSSRFGSRLSYHAGASWKALDHVQFRANVGTGYVEPTMGQLYAPSSWYTFIPNPDLEPEKSLGFDAGPSLTFTSFGAGVNYFHTRYRDLIKMDFPEAEAFTYVNVDEARSHGMEANAWLAPADQVMLQANYTLTRSTYESGTYEGNEMKQKPRQVLNLQADWFPEIAGPPRSAWRTRSGGQPMRTRPTRSGPAPATSSTPGSSMTWDPMQTSPSRWTTSWTTSRPNTWTRPPGEPSGIPWQAGPTALPQRWPSRLHALVDKALPDP